MGLTPQSAPQRLVEPLAHARDCLQWVPGTGNQRRFARDAAGLVLIRCGELGRSYWRWSDQDWADLIDRSGAEFRRRWGGQIGPNARPFVIAYAYLLGGFTAFEQVGRFQRSTLAHRVFGQTAVDDAVGKILAVLGDWGYQRRPERLVSAVCQILLLNRSPQLEDLSSAALAAIRASAAMQESEWVSDLHGIHRPLPLSGMPTRRRVPGTAAGPRRSRAPQEPGRTGSSAGTRPRHRRQASAAATGASSRRSDAGWPPNTPTSPRRSTGPARPARPGSRRSAA
ncbi:hypothetical protein [Streptomyces sp. DASNCL29]|uniref:hypothetical protein n=1 Tax=Streptomyces sp. DASNCL29 TaxID=2583819 RepID=UPI001486017F|nr:hypothetical protein [Streptomyces sp. DASNCL29]